MFRFQDARKFISVSMPHLFAVEGMSGSVQTVYIRFSSKLDTRHTPLTKCDVFQRVRRFPEHMISSKRSQSILHTLCRLSKVFERQRSNCHPLDKAKRRGIIRVHASESNSTLPFCTYHAQSFLLPIDTVSIFLRPIHDSYTRQPVLHLTSP